ncbi:hypothetical protein [uncultured Chloroflexus sp.]|uniref:hypothetical protein n=1 Tax=uncultured Chloroflexus sp. TaxID=214040 RepID=UPI00262704CA|nr:hypothetical protein [uncultured Chloroflexus sp.]
MDHNLIEDKALQRLAIASGGVPTVLIRLAQNAATYATGAKILLADVDKALLIERSFLLPTLSDVDWENLRRRHNDHRLTADDENRSLLYKGALVEYNNSKDGQPWCDAHPILWDLLRSTPEQ